MKIKWLALSLSILLTGCATVGSVGDLTTTPSSPCCYKKTEGGLTVMFFPAIEPIGKTPVLLNFAGVIVNNSNSPYSFTPRDVILTDRFGDRWYPMPREFFDKAHSQRIKAAWGSFFRDFTVACVAGVAAGAAAESASSAGPVLARESARTVGVGVATGVVMAQGVSEIMSGYGASGPNPTVELQRLRRRFGYRLQETEIEMMKKGEYTFCLGEFNFWTFSAIASGVQLFERTLGPEVIQPGESKRVAFTYFLLDCSQLTLHFEGKDSLDFTFDFGG